ncbi:MAG TPA: hypothetical protein PLJ21_02000 [Pseudobdellovibrionaceae bacterium]|nr:hypothetical protein [Pseudobdellovibrionaceae bacterium]
MKNIINFPKKSILSSKGQSLVEFLISFPLILIFLILFFYTLYRSILFLGSHYLIENAFYCLDSKPVSNCKMELEKKLKFLLVLNEQKNVFIKKGQFGNKSKIEVRIYNEKTLKVLYYSIPEIFISKTALTPIYLNLEHK